MCPFHVIFSIATNGRLRLPVVSDGEGISFHPLHGSAAAVQSMQPPNPAITNLTLSPGNSVDFLPWRKSFKYEKKPFYKKTYPSSTFPLS